MFSAYLDDQICFAARQCRDVRATGRCRRYLRVKRERHGAAGTAIEIGKFVDQLVADNHLPCPKLEARIRLAAGLHLEARSARARRSGPTTTRFIAPTRLSSQPTTRSPRGRPPVGLACWLSPILRRRRDQRAITASCEWFTSANAMSGALSARHRG
jgi:hypothetical protein